MYTPLLEISLRDLQRRFLEIIPGSLSWLTLVGLAILAFLAPFWIAIFIIVYDVYIFFRAIYMSVYLVYAHRRLRLMAGINWLDYCRHLAGDLRQWQREVQTQLDNHLISRRDRWQLSQLQGQLSEIIQSGHRLLPWHQVHHAIVIPTYNESLEVLQTSLRALSHVQFPSDRLHVVVGFEERAGKPAQGRASALTNEFQQSFGTFQVAFHPDGLPGEKRVKSANATWAMKSLEKALANKGVDPDYVLVSNFDSDTVVNPNYFAYLTFAFVSHPDRYHVSYQPLPLYNNNLWDAPAFSRVIATGSTFWQLIESNRPERLVTFSSHSMTLRALKDVGYWQTDIISEDSRIFWQCLLYYHGHYRTVPLYTSVSMDAALAPTWWQTLKNQYKQKRRWAWGIENFPYFVAGFLRDRKIPWRVKWVYTFRTLEGHYSWATSAIIVAGLGWLPVLFGGAEFQRTALSYSLPYITRTIMTAAMFGLIISSVLSLLLLPPKPARYSRLRYLAVALQWALFPLIATVLSSFPALDAETRLLLGRDLQFNVMQKTRRGSSVT